MHSSSGPLNVFISYSHKDKEWKERLIPHLNALIRQRYITLWYDNMILPGAEIDAAVLKALHESQIVLLLISSDYLASDYCYDVEMKEALSLREASGVEVIPVLLRPVDLTGTPFDGLKSLPEDRKAVSLFENHDAAYENIAKGIRKVAESWHRRPKPTRPKPTRINGKETACSKGTGDSNIFNNYGFQFNGNIFHGDVKIK